MHQRGDGLWVATASLGVGPDGKRRVKAVYGQTKQEALEKLREFQTRIGKLPDSFRDIRRQTLQDFLATWVVQRVCGSGTKDRYEEHCRLWINPIIGHTQISKLQPSTIAYLYEEMENRGASKNYVRRVGRMLRGALKGCGLPINPAAGVALPRVEKPEVFPLSQEELSRLLKHAKKRRDYDLYVLALDSGMRQGELFALIWSDFDWVTGSVMVQRSLEYRKGKLRTKSPKTKSGRRRIQLAPETIALLKRRYKRAEKEGCLDFPVFHAEKGVWLRQNLFSRDSWLPLRKKAQLGKHRFHDLRHTCATQLLLAGENPKVVSQRLGHSSIEITLSTYAHVLDSMQEEATKRMSGLLNKVLPREEE